jgi:hypothetical protein
VGMRLLGSLFTGSRAREARAACWSGRGPRRSLRRMLLTDAAQRLSRYAHRRASLESTASADLPHAPTVTQKRPDASASGSKLLRASPRAARRADRPGRTRALRTDHASRHALGRRASGRHLACCSATSYWFKNARRLRSPSG